MPPILETQPTEQLAVRSEFFRAELAKMTPALHAQALRLCRDRAAAEDLVQDAILRALRFESTYRVGTNLRAWMRQVLLSLFITHCRRFRREKRALELLTADPCAWTHPDHGPEMHSLSPGMEGAMARLPSQFASVVRLVDLHDHSYRDAAEHLGVPVGTVMSRLHRGRRLLVEALHEDVAAAA